MLPARLSFRLSTHLRGHETVDYEFRVFPCAIVKMSYFTRRLLIHWKDLGLPSFNATPEAQGDNGRSNTLEQLVWP